MKNIFVALSLSALFLMPMGSHAQEVKKADFEAYQQTTNRNLESLHSILRDSLREIGRRVDNGAEALNRAKAYSDNADKLTDRFISMKDSILAFFGLLLGGIITMLYNYFKTKMEGTLARKIIEYEKQLDRVAKTEAESIFLKENSGVLILHKEAHESENDAFKTLETSITRHFKHAKHAELGSLKNFEMSLFIDSGIPNNCRPKVIVLDDDLFTEFAHDGNIQNKNKYLLAFFKKLEDNKVGLCLFGKTQLSSFHLSYLAFANQPYSVYTNLNNLLKYMRVAENIPIH